MQRTYQLNEEPLSIPDAGMETLKRLGTRRKYSDGQTIFKTGDSGEGFCVILTGQIITGRYTSGGNLTIFGVFGPGDVVGQLAYFAGVPRQTDSIADGDVELLWIDGNQCRQALAHDIDLTMLLLRSLATTLVTAANRIEEQSEPFAPIRLAKALLNMHAADNVIKASQQELADYIGVSRVTLSSALRKLRAEGLVATNYGAVTLRDRSALLHWIEQAGADQV